jgi:RNA polymerase sigma-70 factor, ECF subfamily
VWRKGIFAYINLSSPREIFFFLRVTFFPDFNDNRGMKAAEAVLARVETESSVPEIDFEAWVVEEQARIFMLCLRLLRDRDEADSATQDVFVEAHQTLQKRGSSAIQEPAKWLTRVAFNTCYDRLRSKRWMFWQRHAATAGGEALLRITPVPGPNQEDAAVARDIRRRLEKALDRLSVRQRAVFILRHDEDQSFEEIARIMELDTGTVKAHMARAIKKLREELRDLYVR